MIATPKPHYLLFSDSSENKKDSHRIGHWHFALETIDGQSAVEASDEEPRTFGDRLELLAAIRGLEALDQPSHVTLVTPSRYVARGIRFGLAEWKSSHWKWERFGRMVPINNADLWQRIDRTMDFHSVRCHRWSLPRRAEDKSPSPSTKYQTSLVHRIGKSLYSTASRLRFGQAGQLTSNTQNRLVSFRQTGIARQL